MSELLPCPFCGSKAERYTDRCDGRFLFRFVCSNHPCGATTRVGEWSEIDAAEKWNRRAEAPKTATMSKESKPCLNLTDDQIETICDVMARRMKQSHEC
jgi:Lar family restriction alleviation protein